MHIYVEGSVKLPRPPVHYTMEELATAMEMFQKLQRGEDRRNDRIEKVRAALALGQWEKPMQFEIAVDRLLDELAA
jgi:hypothetical protein